MPQNKGKLCFWEAQKGVYFLNVLSVWILWYNSKKLVVYIRSSNFSFQFRYIYILLYAERNQFFQSSDLPASTIMLKLTSPSALSKYFSWTTLATSFNTTDQLLHNSKTSTVIAHLEKVVRRSPVKRPISATVKLYNTFLPNHCMKVSHGGHRSLYMRHTHPFSSTPSTKAMKCSSTSRSVGTTDCPVWAALVWASVKKVVSSRSFALSRPA